MKVPDMFAHHSTAFMLYLKDIGDDVCLCAVLEGVCWHSDEC